MNLVRTHTWALNEAEPKANGEFSDHGVLWAVSECKWKAQHELNMEVCIS